MKMRTCLVMVITLLMTVQVGRADMLTFTDESAFDAALTTFGLTNQSTEDFESFVTGTLIPNGSSLGPFTYDGLPTNAGVDSSFFTSSGSNYLGVVSGANFTTGGITFSFASSNAFGMNMITSDKPPLLSNDDYVLTNGLQSVMLETANGTVVGGTPPFTNEAYFFGIINTDNAFSSVTFNIASGDTLGYTIDDLRIASIPEPNGLFVISIIALACCRRRSRK